jgi:hypothetical protein
MQNGPIRSITGKVIEQDVPPPREGALDDVIVSIPGIDIISADEIAKGEVAENNLDVVLWRQDVPVDAVMPSWEQVVEEMVKALEDDSMKAEIIVNWSAPSNIMEVGNIVLEFFALASLPLDDSIGWFEPKSTEQDAAMMLTWEIPSLMSTFSFFFFCSLGVAALYPFMAYRGTVRVVAGNLGHDDETGMVATMASGEYWYIIFFSLLSSGAYFPVIKTLLSVLACNYVVNANGEDVTATLARETDITCWEGQHLLMVFGSVIGVMLYYPLASFIYPNLQFADKSLDLKYKPTFIILLAQGKLVLTGIAVFFPGQAYLLLSTTLVVYVLFALLNYTMQPCLVQWVNDGRTLF